MSNQSETPRTDARTFTVLSDTQSGTREVVDAGFARELERELNAYKWHVAGHPITKGKTNQTAPSCEICNTAHDGITLVLTERDQWKAVAERLAEVLKTAWQHRCSDGVGGCEAISALASEEALQQFDKFNSK